MDEQHVMIKSLNVRRAGGTLGLVFEIDWEQLDEMSRDHPVTAIAAFEEPQDIENVTAAVVQGGHDALVTHKERQEQSDPEEVQDGQSE